LGDVPHDTHNIGGPGAFRVPIGRVFAGDDACTVIDVAEVFGKAVVQMPPACGVGLGQDFFPIINAVAVAGIAVGEVLPACGVGAAGERAFAVIDAVLVAGVACGVIYRLPCGGVGLAQEFAVPVNVVGIGGVTMRRRVSGRVQGFRQSIPAKPW